MKHLTLMMRSLDVLLVVMAVVLMVSGTGNVVTHWVGNGAVDARGPRYYLLLMPAVLIVYGEIALAVARHRRRRDGMTAISVVLVNEWYYVAGDVVIAVVGALLMLQQTGLKWF